MRHRPPYRALAAVALLLGVGWGVPARAAGPIIEVDPPTVSLQTGERVRVAVRVRDIPAPGLAAFQFRLLYNAAVVRLEDPGARPGFPFAPGAEWFLTSTGRDPVKALAHDNGAGILELAYATKAGPAPPTGSGVIAIVDVVAVAAGQSALDLAGSSPILLVDNSEPPGTFPATDQDGQVTVSGPTVVDSDGDGVPDAQDTCPNTAANDRPVDAAGCGPTQQDADKDGVPGDGVPNGLDRCPNTPLGEAVDANGCSQGQRDDDNDGVPNRFDQCPNTPPGQQVDVNGCAASQRDADRDGVPDDRDQCPLTPQGATDVDASGCSICLQLNRPPVARATGPANVAAGILTVLDGSQSSDPDAGEPRLNGTKLTFEWNLVTKPEGSMATVGSPTSIRATLTPDQPGSYVVRLVVRDGCTASDPVEVTLQATNPQQANVPPNANAGPDQTVPLGLNVTLDGRASADPDNGPQPLGFGWAFSSTPGGSQLTSASLQGAQTAQPTFTPDVAGRYVLTLTVNDGAAEHQDSVNVDVVQVNVAPVANAGPDRTVNLGQTAALDGSASVDPDKGPQQPLSFMWMLLSKPAGSVRSTADIVGANTATPSFKPDVTGEYLLELKVFDGELTSSDNAIVTALGPRRGDINVDGKIDMDDLNLILAARNTQASGPNDARDLNGDGKIDLLDARILVLLCDKPLCAR